jgi:polyisoprenoid-binding protein YceI
MKKISMSIMALLTAGYVQAQTNWVIDPVHSKVNFTVDHLVISEVDGIFKSFSGSLTETNSDFTDAEITFEIVTASMSTDNEKRDGHLKSEDFFYAEKYPKISFKSSSFKKVNDKEYTLKGNLTMRGVTRQVTLTTKYGGQIMDGYGNTRAAFKVTGSLKRMDYGIAWNGKTEHGSLVVGEDVDIEIKLELIKQK